MDQKKFAMQRLVVKLMLLDWWPNFYNLRIILLHQYELFVMILLADLNEKQLV